MLAHYYQLKNLIATILSWSRLSFLHFTIQGKCVFTEAGEINIGGQGMFMVFSSDRGWGDVDSSLLSISMKCLPTALRWCSSTHFWLESEIMDCVVPASYGHWSSLVWISFVVFLHVIICSKNCVCVFAPSSMGFIVTLSHLHVETQHSIRQVIVVPTLHCSFSIVMICFTFFPQLPSKWLYTQRLEMYVDSLNLCSLIVFLTPPP